MEAQKCSDLPEVTSYKVQGTLTQVTSNSARLAALGGGGGVMPLPQLLG